MKNQDQEKGVIYVRVSGGDDHDETEADDKKMSIQTQIEQLTALAAKKGIKIVAPPIVDKHRSSRTYETGNPLIKMDPDFQNYFTSAIKDENRVSRDGLAKVIKMLPEIDCVLVLNQDRLCRSYKHSFLIHYLWGEFAKNNVLVHTPSKTINPNDFTDSLVSKMEDQFEDLGVQKRRSAQLETIRMNRDAGQLYGGSQRQFYGFDYVKTGYNKKSVAVYNAAEIKTVKYIFAEYLAGKSAGVIAKALNAQNIPTPSNGKNWNHKNLCIILKNLWYAGYQKNTSGEIIENEVLKPLAIVSLEDWKLIQARIGRNGGIAKGIIHPLSGLVRCGYCGEKLYCIPNGNPGTTPEDAYYSCSSWRMDKKNALHACTLPRIRIGNLENAIRPLLSLLYLQLARDASDMGKFKTDKDLIVAKIEKLNEKKTALIKADLDPVTLADFAKNISAESVRLQAELKAVNEKIDSISDFSIENIQNIHDRLQSNPVLQRDAYFRIIERIDVFGWDVTITLKSGKTITLPRMVAKHHQRLLPTEISASSFYKDGKNWPVIVYIVSKRDTVTELLKEDYAYVSLQGYFTGCNKPKPIAGFTPAELEAAYHHKTA